MATVTEIYDVPRRKQQGVEAVPVEEITVLRRELVNGTLSCDDAARLQRAGHLHVYNLFHRRDTTALSLGDLTFPEADEIFERLCYKGTDRDRYIVENYTEEGKERSTWQNCFSDPNFLKHLRGERSYGIRKGLFTHMIIVDFDRHSGLVLGKDHKAKVLAFLAFVKEKLPTLRPIVEVNPKNGSTKFFLFSSTPIYCKKDSSIIQMIRDFLGDDSIEIYPDNLYQAFLPGRADKTTIGNGVIARIRRKRYETINGKRKLHWVETFSTKAILEYLLSDDFIDEAVLEKYLDAGIAACLDSEEAAKAIVSSPKVKKAAEKAGGMGSLPKFKGNTLSYLSGLYHGTIEPTPDTIGKVATVLSRGFITGGMDADEAQEATLDFLEHIPDHSFSDRLTSNSSELCRVMGITCNKIEQDNGYQPDSDRSSKKWEICHRYWTMQGIDFCEPETWLHRDYSRKGKTVKMTAQVLDLLHELQSLTFADAEKTEAFFNELVNQVDRKGELSMSLVGVLLKRNGIRGLCRGKMVAIRHFLEGSGVLMKRHKAYWDYRNERSGQRHGDFFVLGLAVQFEEDKSLVLFQPHTPVSIGSVHDRTEEQEQNDDMLMEARFMRCDEQWKDRRTRLGLWPRRQEQVA